LILSREISRKGEATGKPFHPLNTYPSLLLRPWNNDWYYRNVVV